MNKRLKPLILTAGDPSGVGPEITVQAWEAVGQTHPFAVLGSVPQFERLAELSGISCKEIETLEQVVEDKLCIVPQSFAAHPQAGSRQPENAVGTIEMISRAVGFVKDGLASAVVTNPINKKILVDGAGFSYPGHTEFLTDLDGQDRSVMMLATSDLKVVPATIHIPLKDVPQHLSKELISTIIKILHTALVHDFKIKDPKIAVAGLNPHAGEGGQMGHEEAELIEPILDELRVEGIDLTGPLSADTMFHAGARKLYDAAVCMYHDQALIPIKTLDFDKGVNVTLGLSFVRTSPDHGTAYDIAGKGRARPSSLIEAIKMASQIAANRNST